MKQIEKVFVVTVPENGWDCVHNVYAFDTKQEVIDELMLETEENDGYIENNFVITEKLLILK